MKSNVINFNSVNSFLK